MRGFLFLFVLLGHFSQSLAQPANDKTHGWQIKLFSGTSYATPDISRRLSVDPTLYSFIGEAPQPSYSIGFSRIQGLGKYFILEYGVEWQKFGMKINYYPNDTTFWGTYQVSDELRFQFLQFTGTVRRDLYISPKIFLSAGVGLSFHYAISLDRIIVDAIYNPYKTNTIEIDEIRKGASRANMDWHGYVAVGRKIFDNNEISFRLTIQQLFASNYQYSRNLNAKGFSVVYMFGKLTKSK